MVTWQWVHVSCPGGRRATPPPTGQASFVAYDDTKGAIVAYPLSSLALFPVQNEIETKM